MNCLFHKTQKSSCFPLNPFYFSSDCIFLTSACTSPRGYILLLRMPTFLFNLYSMKCAEELEAVTDQSVW